jgi:hypothetical protein
VIWGWSRDMDSGTATVLAALITGFVALVGVLLKFLTENRRDHGKVMDVLHKITGKLDRVDTRVTQHIDWHLQGGTGGQTAQRDTGTATVKTEQD